MNRDVGVWLWSGAAEQAPIVRSSFSWAQDFFGRVEAELSRFRSTSALNRLISGPAADPRRDGRAVQYRTVSRNEAAALAEIVPVTVVGLLGSGGVHFLGQSPVRDAGCSRVATRATRRPASVSLNRCVLLKS